jgi:asparagine synthase (glutamine-hydrolysing)
MCGLAGFLSRGHESAAHLDDLVRAMSDRLTHRGPDLGATWVDQAAGIAFGHRRLSIVDLSPAGAQPMHSADGRWVTIYNGELYNTEDLRAEIIRGGHVVKWRGHSDTEVILEALSIWGLRRTIEKLNGIFALAIWDRRERQLWLVRDRLGVKPMYWTRLPNGTLIFGSELRVLRCHPDFTPQIDPQAVAAFLRSGCIAAPLTIYRGVQKLPPAHILCATADGDPEISCYWNLRTVAAEGQGNLDHRSEEELVEELDALLRDAVSRQLVSDVPLGAFLSGGIDSSTVVALMQTQSNIPARTFSIGFHEKSFNEADHARRVAQHLRTQHTELIVERETTLDVIERLPDVYDEPFADSSQIPTYLVSKLARQHVTVALSGDGGDECFAGYTRYHWIDRLGQWTGMVPKPLLQGGRAALQSLSTQAWDALLSPIPRRLRPNHIGDKIHKGAALLALEGTDDMYRAAISHWSEPSRVMMGSPEPAVLAHDPNLVHDIPDAVARLRYYDMMHYLPDDILTKVDRASMAVSLEVRVPLLDHRVVEYSWRLPRSRLSRGLQGKRILRRVLERYVPASLFERQKMGFGIPLGDWIRGPLAEWTEDLLSERSLRISGLFDVALVRGRVEEHQSGRRNWQYALWTILMFQAWYRRWV